MATVGEIQAVLTAKDEMSKVVKEAQTNVEGLNKSLSADDKWATSPLNPANTSGNIATGATQATEAISKMTVNATGLRNTLNDLANAFGLNVATLGPFDSLLLAGATAMGGWKIGRAVSDFLDLDQAIGDATAKLLGWGDVAGEAAAAKADMLARASARIGYEVKDVTTAMQINALNMTPWKEAWEKSADALAKVQAELDKVRGSGNLPALTADIQSHNFSLKDLAQYYDTTVEAIQLFMRQSKAADDQERDANAEIQRRNAIKLKDLRDEMEAYRINAKERENAIYQLAELEARADESETTRAKNRLKDDEQDAQQRVAMLLAYDQERVKNGTMSAQAFDAEKATIERQGLQRHIDLLHAEEAADITSNGIRLDAELAKVDERYAKGLLTKTEYEAQYAAIERRYAALRAGIQDDYTARVSASQQKIALSAQQAQADMVAAFRTSNDAVMGMTTSFDGWNASVMKVDASVQKLSKDMASMSQGNTLDLPTAAQDPEIMSYLKQGYSLKNAEALKLARQWGFQPQLFDEKGNPESSPSAGEGVPGYAPTTTPRPAPIGGNISIGGTTGGGGQATTTQQGRISAYLPGDGQDQGGVGNQVQLGYRGNNTPTVQVTVQGNVYTMDPSGKAAFGQTIIDALTPLLRQGRLLPNA